MSKVDYSRLFAIGDPVGRLPLRVSYGQADIPDLTCRKVSDLLIKRGEPLVLRGFMGGNKPKDLVWSGDVCVLAVSDRVTALLGGYDFTGWATYPVEIYDRKGEFCPGYHGFAIVGEQTTLQKERCERFDEPGWADPTMRFPRLRGLYFDESEWDGSDFFWVASFSIVTERVAEVLRKAKVNNIELTPLSEMVLTP